MSCPYDWSSVGEHLAGSMLERAAISLCTCSCDPMVKSPLHPCKCGKRGADGLACVWRKRVADMLKYEGMTNAARKSHSAGGCTCKPWRAKEGEGLTVSVFVFC